MIKIRKGLDIDLAYTIMRVTGPEDLTTAQDIAVRTVNVQSPNWELTNSFEIADGNIVKIHINGDNIQQNGEYRLIISYSKYNPLREPHDEPFVVDRKVFEIVPYSDLVGGDNCCSGVEISQIVLSGTIDKCRDGAPGASPEIREDGNWWVGGVDTKVRAKGDKGDIGTTGPSAYDYAVDGGYAGTLAQFVQEQANLANNSEKLTAVEVGKVDLVGGTAPQSQIDPMQGRYTGFSTPIKDNTVKWTGDLAAIGTGDFMIEWVGDYQNAGNGHNLISIGPNSYYGSKSINTFSYLGANQLELITFEGIFRENSINVARTFTGTKTLHSVLCRRGVDAWVLINGVKYSVTQDRVLDIANNLTIANASAFTHLRKFNFADEALAQSLWDGGRWWESTIGEEYRGDYTKYLGGFSGVHNKYYKEAIINATSESINIAVKDNGTSGIIYMPRIPISFDGGSRVCVELEYTSNVDLNIELNSFIEPPITVFFDKEKSSVKFIASIRFVAGGAAPGFVFTNVPSFSFTLSALKISNALVQNEYLPSSLTPTSWRDTAGTSDLLPTNPEKMTLLTESPFKQVLWGAGAPTTAPDFIGQEYLDTTLKVKYTAFGTTNANDWKA